MLDRRIFVVTAILWAFHLLPVSIGDLEPIFAQCCDLGLSWGQAHASCSDYPTPIVGVALGDQSICLVAVEICCTRVHRTKNCEAGKDSARLGKSCTVLSVFGGETHKDCCEGCKLGLVSAGLQMSCRFKNFGFGTPWDESYFDCCLQTLTNNVIKDSSDGPTGERSVCQLFPGQLCAHKCIDIPGSYRCECFPGFKLHTNGKACVQDSTASRCEANNPCEQECFDTGIAIQCGCYPGYQLLVDKRSCGDINECVLGTHTCNPNTEYCHNTLGEFQCLEKSDVAPNSTLSLNRCPLGYLFRAETQTCNDIDECTAATDNCDRSSEICSNTVGSYACVPHSAQQCPPGFKKNPSGVGCIDVDECEEGIHNCNTDIEVCLNSHGAYQCDPKNLAKCPAGFKWNNGIGQCEDIDECVEGTHNCNLHTHTCVNIPSSFHCDSKGSDCRHGYQRNLFTNECADVNECAIGSHDCNLATHYCVNTDGSYQCQTKQQQHCSVGYAIDTITHKCVDIDECNEGAECLANQICENTVGSYRCICMEGFNMDPTTKSCKDINECQLSLHNCIESQRCDNTIGSFTCVRTVSCGTGYTLNAETGECEDDDECRIGTHNCGPGFACRNTEGSFRCNRITCPPRQKLLSDGTCQTVTCPRGMEADNSGNCIDIDECINAGICRANQRCINTVGSYRCQNLLKCGAGYELNEYGNQCIDIDECARGTQQCGANQICRNRAGGYLCECPAGHTMNSKRECVDVDECVRFRGQVCSVNSECQNTIGSYLCNCKAGFRQEQDGHNCVDIDECSETPNLCHQKCINVWGTYQCSCEQGFNLESDNRSCKDIDECSLWEGRRRLCTGFCINEPGSYSCSCPDGYRLSPDKRNCQDVNECEEQSACRGENEVCLNTRGGYRCNSILCPPNYIRDPDHRNRCKRATQDCRQGDATCLKEPLSYSYNYITLVSSMQIPLSGQLDLFTMRGPRFSFTSVQFNLDLKSARSPEGVTAVTREYFHLRRTAFNEAMISIVKVIPGPQDIELELAMKMYHNGLFGGSAVAKIFIFVTQYEY